MLTGTSHWFVLRLLTVSSCGKLTIFILEEHLRTRSSIYYYYYSLFIIIIIYITCDAAFMEMKHAIVFIQYCRSNSYDSIYYKGLIKSVLNHIVMSSVYVGFHKRELLCCLNLNLPSDFFQNRQLKYQTNKCKGLVFRGIIHIIYLFHVLWIEFEVVETYNYNGSNERILGEMLKNMWFKIQIIRSFFNVCGITPQTQNDSPLVISSIPKILMQCDLSIVFIVVEPARISLDHRHASSSK